MKLIVVLALFLSFVLIYSICSHVWSEYSIRDLSSALYQTPVSGHHSVVRSTNSTQSDPLTNRTQETIDPLKVSSDPSSADTSSVLSPSHQGHNATDIKSGPQPVSNDKKTIESELAASTHPPAAVVRSSGNGDIADNDTLHKHDEPTAESTSSSNPSSSDKVSPSLDAATRATLTSKASTHISNNHTDLYALLEDDENAIDIVYTWVNGTDTRLQYQTQMYKLLRPITVFDRKLSGDTLNRYVNHDEMKYSLRSVDKFVPWVRYIHIVTNDQVPVWLDVSNPKIRIVSHRDIFKNKGDLPVFASPAIETNLHRIPGLSRRFLYLNDDVFFMAPSEITDFFTSDGFHVAYRAWPASPCAFDCDEFNFSNSYCDDACNTLACDYDGGDCPTPKLTRWSVTQTLNQPFFSNISICADVCRPTDLGNGICEPSCNIPECIYDLLDCDAHHGLWNLSQRYRLIDVGQNVSTKDASLSIRDVGSPVVLDVGSLVEEASNPETHRTVVRCEYLSTSTDPSTDMHADRSPSKYVWIAAVSQEHKLCALLFHPQVVESSFPLHVLVFSLRFSVVAPETPPVELFRKVFTLTVNVPTSAIPKLRVPLMKAFDFDSSVGDSYTMALRNTSQMMARKFGNRPRSVVAHAPILLDQMVLSEIETIFPDEWNATSSSKFRLPKNIQYAFIHAEYMAHAAYRATARTPLELFRHRIDHNSNSRVDANEMRTLAWLLRFSNMDHTTLEEVYAMYHAANHTCIHAVSDVDSTHNADVYDDIVRCEVWEMVQANHTQFVTADMFKTSRLATWILDFMKHVTARPIREVHGSVRFLQLDNNIERVQRELKPGKVQRFKFGCINDNLDYTQANATEAVQIYHRYMLSLFPEASIYEIGGD